MPEGPPPPFQCGGVGQAKCPPQPAMPRHEESIYTYEDMLRHGHESYQKGLADQAQKQE